MGEEMKRGQPTKYSPKIADAICAEIATTDASILRICARDDMPAQSSVYLWLSKHPEFSEKYARARESQADVLAAQTIAIADDGSGDTVTRYREDGSTYEAVDQEHIQRSRLRVDARKWLASKLAPKKYGDKLDLGVSDGNGGPVRHKITVEMVRANNIQPSE